MADGNRFEVDDAAVRELFSDWSGPVGQVVRDLMARAEDSARARVPHRTGAMAGTIGQVEDHDPYDGSVSGKVTAGYYNDAGFPVINALEAVDGVVWNRSPKGRKRTRGTRRTHPFLTEALDELAGEG